jgi:hypothetical protein
MTVKEHSRRAHKRTAAAKVMVLTAGAGVALLTMIVGRALESQPSATSPAPSVSAPAATPNLSDPEKQTAPAPATPPAIELKGVDVKAVAAATTAAPNPAPTAAVDATHPEDAVLSHGWNAEDGVPEP